MVWEGRVGAKRDVFARKSEAVKRDIDGLLASLYGIGGKDTRLTYLNLKAYRAEVQRGFVLYTHLAIEDLLRALLFDFLARLNRRISKRELIRAVDDLRSADLVHWCGRLKLVKPKWYGSLLELNRIRNACAHNWVLDLTKYRRNHPRRPRNPRKGFFLKYQGKGLLDREVLLHDFCPTYGQIYLGLLGKVWRLQGKI